MNLQINQMVANCDVCQKFRNKQSYEPLMKHDIPSEPWNKVAADLFSLGNNNYMILTDCTSKYFEVCEIPDQTSTSVIKCIKRIFSRFGLPKVLSDNGPCFASYEFKHFLNSWDVKHATSSPLYPRSNGLVERMIQTVKKTIKKCIAGNEDLDMAFLMLRATPISREESSPGEFLMNRCLRTLVPSLRKGILNKKAKNKIPNFEQDADKR